MTTAFDTTERRRFTKEERARLFMRLGGCCYLCGKKIFPGEEYEIEHKVALMNGGSNEESNLGLACENCHPPKTRADHKQAKKGRDIAERHFLPRSQRPSKFRRPPDGMTYDWSKRRWTRD